MGFQNCPSFIRGRKADFCVGKRRSDTNPLSHEVVQQNTTLPIEPNYEKQCEIIENQIEF